MKRRRSSLWAEWAEWMEGTDCPIVIVAGPQNGVRDDGSRLTPPHKPQWQSFTHFSMRISLVLLLTYSSLAPSQALFYPIGNGDCTISSSSKRSIRKDHGTRTSIPYETFGFANIGKRSLPTDSTRVDMDNVVGTVDGGKSFPGLVSASAVAGSTTLSFGRVARLTILAFAASEALAYAGVFGEEERGGNIHRIRSTAQDVIDRYELREKVEGTRRSVLEWWARARGPNGMLNPDHVKQAVRKSWNETRGADVFITPLVTRFRSLPPNTKFAIGAAVGLMSSHAIISLSLKAATLVGVTYLALEVCDAFGIIGDEETGLGKLGANHQLVHNLNSGLEQARDSIQRYLNLDNLRDSISNTFEAEGAAASGLVAGCIGTYLLF